MFKIIDGRDALWQWDKDRQLIVEDDSITEVHFCNCTDDVALVCEVFYRDGLYLVNVPNILLQKDWDIRVYAYCGYTKIEELFKVHKRTKPADYIYTETEIKNYDDLKARVDEIEKHGVSQEAINAAVSAYLEENPIEPGATAEEAAQIEQNRLDIIELQNKKVDLTGYATEDYVDNAVNSLDIPTVPTKVSAFENDAGYLTQHQSLDAYALKSEIPDVSRFITEIPAEYITESELNAKGYLTEHQSLDGYAKTTDIPDVSGFTTMAAVEAKGYQTQAQVQALISAALVDGEAVSY